MWNGTPEYAKELPAQSKRPQSGGAEVSNSSGAFIMRAATVTSGCSFNALRVFCMFDINYVENEKAL